MSSTNTQAQAEQNFNLVSFVVCIETKIKNRTHTDFISPLFETAGQAQQFKAQVMDENPQCFIQENTAYFRSEDDGNRLELLAKIVKAVHLPEDYPIENRDDFFILICKTDDLMPVVWRDSLMLMRKNFKAEVGDVVMVNSDHLNPRIEFCAVAGVYPAVCVAAKPQLLEILPDGSVSKPL